jgi:hypothetical protein
MPKDARTLVGLGWVEKDSSSPPAECSWCNSPYEVLDPSGVRICLPCDTAPPSMPQLLLTILFPPDVEEEVHGAPDEDDEQDDDDPGYPHLEDPNVQ